MRFAFVNRQGRLSVTSTVLPIWVAGSFKPVRVGLIEGETELLSGMDIVSELDIRVRFGIKQFRVGWWELEMMTFNEKRHWAFPLCPTACAYAKLGDYFGKMQKSQIDAMQAQGDFGDHLEVRQLNTTKNQRLERKWRNSK